MASAMGATRVGDSDVYDVRDQSVEDLSCDRVLDDLQAGATTVNETSDQDMTMEDVSNVPAAVEEPRKHHVRDTEASRRRTARKRYRDELRERMHRESDRESIRASLVRRIKELNDELEDSRPRRHELKLQLAVVRDHNEKAQQTWAEQHAECLERKIRVTGLEAQVRELGAKVGGDGIPALRGTAASAAFRGQLRRCEQQIYRKWSDFERDVSGKLTQLQLRIGKLDAAWHRFIIFTQHRQPVSSTRAAELSFEGDMRAIGRVVTAYAEVRHVRAPDLTDLLGTPHVVKSFVRKTEASNVDPYGKQPSRDLAPGAKWRRREPPRSKGELD